MLYDGETAKAAASRHCGHGNTVCAGQVQQALQSTPGGHVHGCPPGFSSDCTFKHRTYAFVCPGESIRAAADRFCSTNEGVPPGRCRDNTGEVLAKQLKRVEEKPFLVPQLRLHALPPRKPTCPGQKTWDVVISRCHEGLGWLADLSLAVPIEVSQLRVYVFEKCGNGGRGNTTLGGICGFQCSCSLVFSELPNTGFESHTYSKFMVDNWSHFASTTIFLQGDPFDHIQSSAFRREFYDILVHMYDGLAVSSVDGQPHSLQHQHSQISDGFGSLSDTFMHQDSYACPGECHFDPGEFCRVFDHLFANNDSDRYGDGVRPPRLTPAHCPDRLSCFMNSMFFVSDTRLMQRPLSFYQRLLAVTDGSLAAIAPYYRGQPFKLESVILERLWHMILGKPCHQAVTSGGGGAWFAAPHFGDDGC